ncbi:hypothetical protein FE257_011921 [Aspergillus nanangensis]|uniref:feruloyl esterase n=1 Tax=Aspergillus nanangensis TaxID=2582783 RepID=A0AAD4GSA6_ASPNN|nr:hypothetical protein FE257_011921 [Aspergillus nanangensis]
MNSPSIFKILLFGLAYVFWICTARVVPINTGGEIFSRQSQSSNRLISREAFNSLEELARIVDVSYCVGGTGVQTPFECLSHCSEFEGFELITTWHTGPFLSDSCGYVALSHRPFATRIIIAFRGTYSIANTVIDLSAYPQGYVPYDAGGDGDGEETPQCHNCTVHAGFMRSWESARPTVLHHVSAARERYPDYKVVLVGHSLGGAVAALAGVEMQLRGWEPEVTTFGEPKVGNKGFSRFLNDVFDLGASSDDYNWRFRRVTHVNDPVPLLPLEEWGYEPHAGEIFISKPDLSPSISDLVLCEGNSDAQCISGAEETTLHAITSAGVSTGALPSLVDSPQDQEPLSDQSRVDSVRDVDHDSGVRLSRVSAPWHLIPAKYRLWELFISHRDYFWRIGLCVPGGDPTGRGEYFASVPSLVG